jgi:hypothetical protein
MLVGDEQAKNLVLTFHRAVNLNDGLYGNANSWIPNFVAGDPAPFAGINLGRRRLVSSIAWGRDNGNVAGDCCGGTLTDRALGVYVLQVTTAPNPGAATPEACGPNPDSGWVTVGTINFKASNPTLFNPHLRHRFDVSQSGAPIAATGIRIKVPNANSAIDEIEVNSNVALESRAIRITTRDVARGKWRAKNSRRPPRFPAAAQAAGVVPFREAANIPFLRAHLIKLRSGASRGRDGREACKGGYLPHNI